MLDDRGLLDAVAVLRSRDRDLAGIVERHGPPPLWAREPGFVTLVQVILEQQVSLRSAEAAMTRLRDAVGEVTPAAILRAGPERLLAAGLTRQKTRYLVELAGSVESGALDLPAIDGVDDEEARERLVGILGVGRWTADIYLLMALRRPDVWPTGDVALASAMRHAKSLEATPPASDQLAIAEPWRPFRSVAARILWHAYLAGER